MTEQDVANLITFCMALLLGAVAFIAGWFWGHSTCENQHKNKG